ncbi:hypothetical protein TBR22_A13870 [Luteitalea sp. TBR-22]|uniref:hypothetical protein n=1 Tax=Luteitalea sp. TBR-22 TaxID=2802971 RepID=UPI001AF2B32B|nr:hypothetical protein [Luteitalea sp. TBR-22]BCS32177.1 hypothetical protein TBR22_A13870 [Luteitalea sp. TBR-22]
MLDEWRRAWRVDARMHAHSGMGTLARRAGRVAVAAALGIATCAGIGAQERSAGDEARARAADYATAMAACQRTLQAWLRDADPVTTLMPDRVTGQARVATPHNFSADLYPYLILTARFTDPAVYEGRMMEILRNEVRYMTADGSVPGNYDIATRTLGPASLFGAGEYAKDGLITVTELLGRTAWFHRMADMIADAMERAPHETRWGRIPAVDSELNGDFLQVLVRLSTMTGDPRYLAWARRIGDAYVEEVLPGNFGVPSTKWDFVAHGGETQLRLRDHGNELVVGLTLLYALEADLQSDRAARYGAAVKTMLDRILQSANPDGMLYNQVDARTLAPIDRTLSDNWGYVYGAMYTYYQVTGDTTYRDAVRRVLGNLPKYRRQVWEPRPPDANLPLGSFDGYADAIESALYLVNREPVPAALDWIESETRLMLDMQRADGHLEDWYGEGNFNRTLLLWALMKSQGVMPADKATGLQLGAVREGDALRLHVGGVGEARLQFDIARHRRVINLSKNYVRLNEFPEWFVVEPHWLYRITGSGAAPRLRLGAELMQGERFAAGDWTVTPLGPPPYGTRAQEP